MSKARTLLTALGILAGALVLATVMVLARPDPPLRPPPSNIPFVTVAAAEPGDGPIRVFGSGSVRPSAEVDVAAQVSGRVSWVDPAFQGGGRVQRGQLLFQIDPADFENRVEQARADVAAQEVAVLQAEEEARIARSEYDQFRAREQNRASAVGGSPSALTLREPQLAAARASRARAVAVLADAELALARTGVTAPFNGVVRQEAVDEGQFVAAGQSVGRLYAGDVVEILVPLGDSDASLIPGLWGLRPGDDDRSVPAEVTTDTSAGRFTWSGHVDRAEAALDETTRTINVVVRVPNPFAPGRQMSGAQSPAGPPLLVGQFVDVAIQGVEPERYFVAPRRALRTDNEVWAVRSDTLVSIIPVRVLQRSEEEVYLTGALTPGQPLIVSGLSVATEGTRVRTEAGTGL